ALLALRRTLADGHLLGRDRALLDAHALLAERHADLLVAAADRLARGLSADRTALDDDLFLLDGHFDGAALGVRLLPHVHLARSHRLFVNLQLLLARADRA